MNPLRSLLNLFRRKKQPVPPAMTAPCERCGQDMDAYHQLVKWDGRGYFKICHGCYTQINQWLNAYRKINQ